MVKLLAAGGADISLKDRSGKTPLDLCDGDEVKEVLLKIQNGARDGRRGLSQLESCQSLAGGASVERGEAPRGRAQPPAPPPRSAVKIAEEEEERRKLQAEEARITKAEEARRKAEQATREAEEAMKRRQAEEAAEEEALIAAAEAAEKAAMEDIVDDPEPVSPSQVRTRERLARTGVSSAPPRASRLSPRQPRDAHAHAPPRTPAQLPITPAERQARSEKLKQLRLEAASAAKAKANKWKAERESKRNLEEEAMRQKKEEMMRLTKEESEIKKRLEEEKKRKKEEDARIKAEAVAAIIAAVKEPELAVDEAKEGQYSYEQIKGWSTAEQMRQNGIRATRREFYLSEKEFAEVFGAPPSRVAALPSALASRPPAAGAARVEAAKLPDAPLCAASSLAGMTKDDFYNQAKWKQDKQKKEKGLF